MGPLIFLYPIAEFSAWYWFIDRYSFWDAFWLCLSTSLVGLSIASMQGRAMLQSIARNQGQMQMGSSMMNRLAVVFGGLFLFTPGLIGKACGTLLILPGTRHLFIWITKTYFSGKVMNRGFHFFMSNVPGGGGAQWASSAANENDMRNVFEIKPQSIEHKIIDDDPNRH